MFVDELTISAKAGDGGDGVVRWLRLRYMPKGGPAGGNGGKGGDVYIRGVRDLNILSKYTGEKRFTAKRGEDGRGRSRFGHDGEDLYIDLPVGSTVKDLKTGRVFRLDSEGETHKILKGGQGGLGNEQFKSSTNQTPQEFTKGTKGEESEFLVELSLVVDAGFVGLPNAGKSTLLNALTNAKSAIGAYPFTTLEPHLGSLAGFVLADIPGLIAGAADGKGLGHKFLRHVRRTRMLLHLVSLENEDPMEAYETVRAEMQHFDPALIEKEEWIVLTKSDLMDGAGAKKAFETKGKRVFVISGETGVGVKELQDALVQHLEELRSVPDGE